MDEVRHAGGLAYREAGPAYGPCALLVHGYPETSWMWRPVLRALADGGWRALAPDLAGYGDSPPDPPGTWTRHVESLERFRRAVGVDRAALVVHDWGGLIGLRWACEHPDAVGALVISNTGFFPDGKWHGMAESLRKPGTGESLVDGLTRESFVALMDSVTRSLDDRTIDEYYKAFGDAERRAGMLELYRSGEFSELHAYDECLARLDVPTLILWGSEDAFAPVAGAHRFAREIPHAELVVMDGVGHFLFDDVPAEAAATVASFLGGAGLGASPRV